jgi:Fe-S-cluster containining protein
MKIDSNKLILMPIDKRYIFNLGIGCPKLIDSKCAIHKTLGRPKVCSDFPIFICDNAIIITDDCPAIRENKLYSYLAEFKQLGYKIIYSKR